MASPEIAASEVVDALSNLVAKSLVAVEVGAIVARYRLLDTTRANALEKSARAGNVNDSPVVTPNTAEASWIGPKSNGKRGPRPNGSRLADYGRQIDNLRAALDWAFSPDGDASIAVALAAAAVPLWMHLSLMAECRGRVERALAAMEAGGSPDARLR